MKWPGVNRPLVSVSFVKFFTVKQRPCHLVEQLITAKQIECACGPAHTKYVQLQKFRWCAYSMRVLVWWRNLHHALYTDPHVCLKTKASLYVFLTSNSFHGTDHLLYYTYKHNTLYHTSAWHDHVHIHSALTQPLRPYSAHRHEGHTRTQARTRPLISYSLSITRSEQH